VLNESNLETEEGDHTIAPDSIPLPNPANTRVTAHILTPFRLCSRAPQR